MGRKKFMKDESYYESLGRWTASGTIGGPITKRIDPELIRPKTEYEKAQQWWREQLAARKRPG